MPERTGTFPFGNEDRSQSPTISVFHVKHVYLGWARVECEMRIGGPERTCTVPFGK